MTGSICEHVTDVDSAKTFAAIELSKASWLVALHLPSHDKILSRSTPAMKPDMTASGCIGCCTLMAFTTRLSIRRASRSAGGTAT